MPSTNPEINKTGNKIHPRNIINPPIIIKSSRIKPTIIKAVLIKAPKNRDIKLDKRTFKYSPIVKPRPLIQ